MLSRRAVLGELMDTSPPAIESPKPHEAPAPTDHAEDKCILVLYCHEKEASLIQISPWLGVGGGWRSTGPTALASLGAGVDATIAVASLFQPPGGDNGGKIRVRVGPWGGIESPIDRFRGEGGLSLAFRQERFEAWGTLGLRAGAGLDTRGVMHWVGNVSWGIYGEPLEHDVCWGACESAQIPSASVFGITNGIRLFASFRREVPANIDEWTFGVELQPEWLLPLSSGLEYKRWRRH
jgi:hypothetical protein